MKGVLDRFLDNDRAVILIESIGKEIHIHRDDLPTESTEQTWFNIHEHKGQYMIDSIDHEQTKKASEKSMSLQEKLQAKMKPSKYKK